MYTIYEYTRTEEFTAVETLRAPSLQTHPVPAGFLAAGVFDEALVLELLEDAVDGAERKTAELHNICAFAIRVSVDVIENELGGTLFKVLHLFIWFCQYFHLLIIFE